MTTMRIFPLVLIFSGGIEDIIDRVLYDRHVTDFVNMGMGACAPAF